ncbi:MAG: 50S ribosomal protein L20 [Bacillota bacterium]|nr:50S ribosomal protein L20 [Bacillota bacterium]
MSRVKRGVAKHARHKRVLKLAKGYRASYSKLYRVAKQQTVRSGAYAFAHRRKKKGDFRKLWITRINAAARMNDISYSRLMNGLHNAGVTVNRKMLSEIAIADPAAFTGYVEIAKANLK